MGRFNKVSPSKGFNNAKNQSDRSGSTDESFFVSRKNPTKTETKFKTISPTRTNLNNQEGFKITNKSTNKPMKHKDGKIGKKPFDKKTWRLQKYSKKYKLEQWEEKRKKAILRGYYKEIKDDKPKIDVQKIYEQYDSDNEEDESGEHNFVRNPNLKKRSAAAEDDEINEEQNEMNPVQKGQKNKNKAFNKAKLEFERLKGEKAAEKEERLRQKQEREEALKLYKKKKNEKYKKLNKKTKRGQPIMKDRIEMLLEKIQSS